MRERKFVKLRVDMYEDTKFKIIDRMEQRDLIHYVWTRLITLAGKVNLEGELFLSRNIPYTIETLAIEFNREASQVELAINTLINLEMVELTEDKIYRVKNFAKHQNIKKEKKLKPENADKVNRETNFKAIVSKSAADKFKVEEQSNDKCKAITDLSSKVIPLSNVNMNDVNVKEETKTSDTSAGDNSNIINTYNISDLSNTSFVYPASNRNSNTIDTSNNTSGNNVNVNNNATDTQIDDTQNVNAKNNISCINQTENNSMADADEILLKKTGQHVFEKPKKEKSISNDKRKRNNTRNEINVKEDEGEIIEVYSSEIKLGKNERILSTFSF